MSTSSLPSYVDRPALARAPTYTNEPAAHEQRLAYTALLGPGANASFVKQSKHGGVSLRLTRQAEEAALPIYSQGVPVEGTVNLSESKAEGIESVEVKVSRAMLRSKFGSTDYRCRSKGRSR